MLKVISVVIRGQSGAVKLDINCGCVEIRDRVQWYELPRRCVFGHQLRSFIRTGMFSVSSDASFRPVGARSSTQPHGSAISPLFNIVQRQKAPGANVWKSKLLGQGFKREPSIFNKHNSVSRCA
jgi:hypothetical protein